MTTTFIILGALLLSAAVVLTFRPLMPASLAAYASMWMFQWSGVLAFPASTMLFWGLATLIVLGLDRLLPAAITRGVDGRGYICGGALAGMVVGMLMSSAGIILGAVIGAFLGAMAYSRTPLGKALPFPSADFLRFLCARGLPAVVAVSMVGLALCGLLAIYGPVGG